MLKFLFSPFDDKRMWSFSQLISLYVRLFVYLYAFEYNLSYPDLFTWHIPSWAYLIAISNRSSINWWITGIWIIYFNMNKIPKSLKWWLSSEFMILSKVFFLLQNTLQNSGKLKSAHIWRSNILKNMQFQSMIFGTHKHDTITYNHRKNQYCKAPGWRDRDT